MLKKIAAGLIVVGVVASFVVTAGASNHQITICHATASATNPYVAVHPTKQQIYDDHGHRTGQESVHPGDIIPPFAAGSHGGQEWGAFAGQNWDAEGRATWNNSCEPVAPTTTTIPPTTTTVLPTTTTTEPPTTTTTEPEPPAVVGGHPITPPTPAVVPPASPPAVVEGGVTELPRTGSNMVWIASAGFFLMLMGLLASAKSRRMT